MANVYDPTTFATTESRRPSQTATHIDDVLARYRGMPNNPPTYALMACEIGAFLCYDAERYGILLGPNDLGVYCEERDVKRDYIARWVAWFTCGTTPWMPACIPVFERFGVHDNLSTVLTAERVHGQLALMGIYVDPHCGCTVDDVVVLKQALRRERRGRCMRPLAAVATWSPLHEALYPPTGSRYTASIDDELR